MQMIHRVSAALLALRMGARAVPLSSSPSEVSSSLSSKVFLLHSSVEYDNINVIFLFQVYH